MFACFAELVHETVGILMQSSQHVWSPQWIGSARGICVHLCASVANLASLRDSIAFGSLLPTTQVWCDHPLAAARCPYLHPNTIARP
jgi:hypothetical protein